MARLINESGVLGDAVEVTAETVKDVPFDKIIEAIGVVQDELGITGTTAKEAATTLSGSLAAVKAAFSNVLGGLTLGQDITPALEGLAESVTTFLFDNLLPAVGNILKGLLPGAAALLGGLAPQLFARAQQLAAQFCAGFAAAWPQLIEQGGSLLAWVIDGIRAALPQLFQTALDVIATLVNTLVANAPQALQTGAQLLASLIDGIRTALPQMLIAAGQAAASMLSGLLQHLPEILAAGFALITILIQGIGSALPGILAAAGEVCSMLWDTITQVDWLGLGRDIIQVMINGIGEMAGAVWEAAKNIARSALNAIKSFLGIASPSRVMADEVGRWIAPGIAEGITGNMGPLQSAMAEVKGQLTRQLDGVQGRLSAALRLDLEAIGGPAASGGQPGMVQNIYFEQPMQAPDEIARALRIQQTYGLAGAR